MPLIATLSYPHLVASVIFWSIAQWIGPLTTTALTRAMGLPLGYRKLALISVLRLPAKYLPGGIWQSVARFSAYREHDIEDRDSFAILFAEHLIALGTSIALGAALLLHGGTAAAMGDFAPWILGLGLAILALPMIWISRTRSGRRAPLLTKMAVASLATLLFWCLAAAAFCTYWIALFDLQAVDILRIASCYLLSWAVGFVALFAPQGLGVFEWVTAQLLPATQALSVTVAAAAGFRLVTIAGDLAAWAVGVLIASVGAAPAGDRDACK